MYKKDAEIVSMCYTYFQGIESIRYIRKITQLTKKYGSEYITECYADKYKDETDPYELLIEYLDLIEIGFKNYQKLINENKQYAGTFEKIENIHQAIMQDLKK